MTTQGGPGDATDAAMVQLVRLVLDDAWTAPGAAVQLRQRVPDEAVLRRVHARVSQALAERASTVAERAAATLDLTLSLGPPRPASPPTPQQPGEPLASSIGDGSASQANRAEPDSVPDREGHPPLTSCEDDATRFAALVQVGAVGDGEGWNQMVNRFAQIVWDTARMHGLSRAEAAQVSHTTWARTADHLDRIHPEGMAAWLIITAGRESVRLLRLYPGPSHPSRSGQDDHDTAISTIDLHRLVTRMFGAGLAITACRTLVDANVASRLESVIDMLDSMIHDVRQAAFLAHGALSVQAGRATDNPSHLDAPDRPEGETNQQDCFVPILTQASVTVEGLWRLARNDHDNQATVALGEASQSLQRALLALEEAKTDW